MSGYVGILVSDPWLQNQFTQVELRSLKSHVYSSLPSLCFSSSFSLCFDDDFCLFNFDF